MYIIHLSKKEKKKYINNHTYKLNNYRCINIILVETKKKWVVRVVPSIRYLYLSHRWRSMHALNVIKNNKVIKTVNRESNWYECWEKKKGYTLLTNSVGTPSISSLLSGVLRASIHGYTTQFCTCIFRI